MSVTVLTRWNGGSRDQFVTAGKKVAPIFKNLGGEFRIGQIYSGPYAGQFMSSMRCPDWETYGRVMAAVAEDSKYQKTLAEGLMFSQLADRTVIVGVEL